MLIPRYINRILVWFARCVFLRYLFLAPFRAHARGACSYLLTYYLWHNYDIFKLAGRGLE